jgi:hypothetical protein
MYCTCHMYAHKDTNKTYTLNYRIIPTRWEQLSITIPYSPWNFPQSILNITW